jgi:iron complex transport system substrate-binding protein
MRVVSLLPSATEIVSALGVDPVATSHECDYPPPAAGKPAVDRSRVDPDAAPGEINDQVVAAERAGGVYEIDLGALERADPDVVLSQGICDVCAVDSVLVRDAIEELGLDCEVVTTDPHTLSDVLDDVERIGAVLDRAARARDLRASLEARIEAVRERARAAAERAGDRPRVAVLDWPDPPMVAGHWVPGMVESLGAEYGLEEPEGRSRPREWSEIRAYDPEVLVVAPCGFDLEQTTAHLDALTDREGWDELAAVREDHAYAMDGHRFLNRPGPRLVDSLEYLAGLIRPEAFEAPPGDVARPVPAATGEPTGAPATDD